MSRLNERQVVDQVVPLVKLLEDKADQKELLEYIRPDHILVTN